MALLTESIFDWRTLTGVQNEIKNPNSFLTNLLFQNTATYETDLIEWHVRKGGRRMSPFVKKGSRAQLIKGLGHDVRQLKFPTIKLKMEIEPHKYLRHPAPGVISAIGGSDQSRFRQSGQTLVQQDMEEFDRYISNTLEWMVGQLLSGSITYDGTVGASEETDAFKVTYPRDAANTITLTDTVDDWDTTGVDPAVSMRQAKIQLSEAVGQTADVMIMGKTASAEFVKNAEVKKSIDYRRLNQAGPLELGGARIGEGAVYEGTYAGLDVWTYDRTVDIVGADLQVVAAAQDIINPKSAFILSTRNANSNFRVEYGGIHDYEAFTGTGTLAMRRFAKAWTDEERGNAFEQVETRPLPVPLEVDSIVEIVAIA